MARYMLLLASGLLSGASLLAAAEAPAPSTLTIPGVSRPPKLEDFLDMVPDDGHGLVAVEGFLQRFPDDGKPATQRTVVYLGYDDKNLYVIFVCFDTEPQKIRARLGKREEIFGDEVVLVILDTFNDARRGYGFVANPLGIQADFLLAEGQDDDISFDTLWHSEGKRTPQGYVVRMALPFRSLRFPSGTKQTWRIAVGREISRYSEQSWWPHISQSQGSPLRQTARFEGLENISPGRNLQFIPYGFFRSLRVLDPQTTPPRFVSDAGEADGGLDAKFVLKDSLVLDVALNPDFSQIESDEPQVTVNRRFEVFFPEKRPFFLENATFFRTPFNLVFTRRVADPQYGVRLTGKVGPYALGAFFVDDEAPGKRVLPSDPLFNQVFRQRAYFGIVRINRDLLRQSSVGLIATAREFEGTFNRVIGPDLRFFFTPQWVLEGQAVTSNTHFLDGTRQAGPAYRLELNRNGRSFNQSFAFRDISPGFFTASGFISRTDLREINQFVSYRFWPEKSPVQSFGPSFFWQRLWNHAGERQDWQVEPAFNLNFHRQTGFGTSFRVKRERFGGIDFEKHRYGLGLGSSYFSGLNFFGGFNRGTEINFSPPAASNPFLANSFSADFGTTLRPIHPLRIDTLYIHSRLSQRGTGVSIFHNDIARLKINYQFTRRLSLRAIFQYDLLLLNPGLIDAGDPKQRNFTTDFLLTYLVNPGTALYIGYNGIRQNLALTNDQVIRTSGRFHETGKQFFVKFSYLFRF